MTTTDPQVVLVHTVDGSYVRLRNVPADEVMAIVESLNDDENTGIFSFDLDNGRSQVHIPRAAIVRIDVDWEIGWLRRLADWLLIQLDRWR